MGAFSVEAWMEGPLAQADRPATTRAVRANRRDVFIFMVEILFVVVPGATGPWEHMA
jgi:hypothetical protein